MALKTIADRRARVRTATVPAADAPFSDEERAVFGSLDRRLRPRPPGAARG